MSAERLRVLAEVEAAVRALKPKYLNPDRPNPLLESGFALCKEAVYAELRRLRAASPVPPPTEHNQPKE